ncbi:Uncharacterized protein Adt_03436 [Abeliophyllum distichum]|uniref:Transposase (putative) gypsy type domain-containing protein n=1 Tax=Abeliophyllum distichum TaxID=126358 RepID=A0ABD1VYH3_9LAMI
MPRVVSSTDSQENSSPSSNFSPESSGSHLSVDRPFGVVGLPIGNSRSTAPLGAVDRPFGDGRLPHGSSQSTTPLGADRLLHGRNRSTTPLGAVDYPMGAVGRLLPWSRSTAPFGVVDGNFLADRHACGNVEIERSSASNIVELEIPKACSLYSSQKKLNRMLGKFFLYDDYVYRAPLHSEQLPGSDLRKIAVYKDSMDGGLRFPLHPLFISIFNEFHFTPSQMNPNAWRLALYFLYMCLYKRIEPSIDLFRHVFELHHLPQCNAYVYLTSKINMQVPRYRNSNCGWKSRFFFVRPSKDQFPFCTKWRHPQVRLFNSPFEKTPLVESQVKILECLDLPASRLSDVLTEENMLSAGLFKSTGMKFNLAGVLGSVPLATDDEGPSSPGQARRRKTATKAKRVAGDKNALDDDRTAGDSPVPDLRFPPAHARRDMEVMRSCVISHMSEGISRRKIEDIVKVLAVYNRKVLTLEDSLVKAWKRRVTNLEVVGNEKSKEIHHLKKKNSNLRNSCEASEARVKEQEEEIDNL